MIASPETNQKPQGAQGTVGGTPGAREIAIAAVLFALASAAVRFP